MSAANGAHVGAQSVSHGARSIWLDTGIAPPRRDRFEHGDCGSGGRGGGAVWRSCSEGSRLGTLRALHSPIPRCARIAPIRPQPPTRVGSELEHGTASEQPVLDDTALAGLIDDGDVIDGRKRRQPTHRRGSTTLRPRATLRCPPGQRIRERLRVPRPDAHPKRSTIGQLDPAGLSPVPASRRCQASRIARRARSRRARARRPRRARHQPREPRARVAPSEPLPRPLSRHPSLSPDASRRDPSGRARTA
jgi:hypothetical protein